MKRWMKLGRWLSGALLVCVAGAMSSASVAGDAVAPGVTGQAWGASAGSLQLAQVGVTLKDERMREVRVPRGASVERKVPRNIDLATLPRGGMYFQSEPGECICVCTPSGCEPAGCANCPVPLCPGGYMPPCEDAAALGMNTRLDQLTQRGSFPGSTLVPGIGKIMFPGDHFSPSQVSALQRAGARTLGDVASMDTATLSRAMGVDERQGRTLQQGLRRSLR